MLMHTRKDLKVAKGNAGRGLTAAAVLTLIAALPGWAAAPANFKTADIGTVGAAGSVDVNATTGVWTVKGAGDMPDTECEQEDRDHAEHFRDQASLADADAERAERQVFEAGEYRRDVHRIPAVQ